MVVQMTGANKSAKFPSRAPVLTSAAILIFAFIYLPVVVLIVYSFNRDGVGGLPWSVYAVDRQPACFHGCADVRLRGCSDVRECAWRLDA